MCVCVLGDRGGGEENIVCVFACWGTEEEARKILCVCLRVGGQRRRRGKYCVCVCVLGDRGGGRVAERKTGRGRHRESLRKSQGEGGRERETDRQTDRQTETDRQRDRQTDRQTDRDRERQRKHMRG